MQYDARLKYQMDEAARLKLARDEGVREGIQTGIQKGELLGQIKLLQKLLGVTKPTADELSKSDEVQLTELAEQLQNQLRTRGQPLC